MVMAFVCTSCLKSSSVKLSKPALTCLEEPEQAKKKTREVNIRRRMTADIFLRIDFPQMFCLYLCGESEGYDRRKSSSALTITKSV